MALRDRFERFRRVLPQPFVAGNRVAVLVDGGAYFRAVLDAIAIAQRTIFLETYIYQPDRTGWRIARALAEASRRGVEVAVCWDGYGSLSMTPDLVAYLHDAGVRTLAFRPVSLKKRVWPWQKRNHRKSVVVDTAIGIVGGQNIGDDYAAPEDGGRNWRDTAVRIEGPAVVQLETMFRRIWAAYGGAPLVTPSSRPPVFDDGQQVRFLGNFVPRDRRYVRRELLVAVLGAEREIRITNAYFVPDRVLTRALIRAAKRGVRVEVIVGGATDVRPVLHMSRGLYARLLTAGVKLYEWHERVLHAKTTVIDREWCSVGSMNLDPLSQFRNLEVSAAILGDDVAAVVNAQFDRDAAQSKLITLDRWHMRSLVQRFVEWLFTLARTWFYRR
ncbi:phosphatidylserine/phosphatidylglycerophosphate/cardiolipin synthase family protein [Myxococcota bacterium]|nr:phosphatidylserine/phosphatidylglycerophosphate/cardiolipin synthase family protein [Myxococcota bacterium]